VCKFWLKNCKIRFRDARAPCPGIFYFTYTNNTP
jgi:hypothetical protein